MYTLLSMADPKFTHIDLFGYKLPTFSFMLVLGILLFAFVYFFRLRKNCVDEKTIDRLTIITLVCGMFTYLGAAFFDDLWHAIKIARETNTALQIDFSLDDPSNKNNGPLWYSTFTQDCPYWNPKQNKHEWRELWNGYSSNSIKTKENRLRSLPEFPREENMASN